MSSSAGYVLDTNTLVSAVLSEHSIPGQAFPRALKRGEALVSPSTLEELAGFQREEFDRYVTAVVTRGIIMKVADLTVEELQTLIRKVVHEELQDIFADPDKGLELTDEIQARLQASLASSDRIRFEEVKGKLNLA